MTSNLLDRNDWLRRHGFEPDLFDFDSWNADTDIHIVENFVRPKNYSLLVGELKHPGHCFIFAPSGGGKTHLRRYIKAQFNDLSLSDEKVLVVEYDISQYGENANTSQHIQRLVGEVNTILANQGKTKIEYLDSVSPKNMLDIVAKACHQAGYDYLYVLVDNIINQGDGTLSPDTVFLRISELIKNFSLFGARNNRIVFKYFMPLELYEVVTNLYGNKIPAPPVLLWDFEELREILHGKLVGCVSREIRSDRSFEFFTELFEWSLRNTIIDEIIDFGVQAGSPRAMLLLGSCILGEHFDGVKGRMSDDLITREEVMSALNKSETEIMLQTITLLRETETDKGEFNTSYDVFISHAWEDNEFTDKLRDVLREKGLRVWYDKSEVVVGDKIVVAIENGLKTAKYVIVVLSPSYFNKKWTKEELFAALNLETVAQKKILPIWHGVTIEQMKEFSPILSSRLGLRSDMGIEKLVLELLLVIRGKNMPH